MVIIEYVAGMCNVGMTEYLERTKSENDRSVYQCNDVCHCMMFFAMRIHF